MHTSGTVQWELCNQHAVQFSQMGSLPAASTHREPTRPGALPEDQGRPSEEQGRREAEKRAMGGHAKAMMTACQGRGLGPHHARTTKTEDCRLIKDGLETRRRWPEGSQGRWLGPQCPH